MTLTEAWTQINILEKDVDHFACIWVIESENADEPVDDTWEEAWRQFQVDFPRCRVHIDGVRAAAGAGACLRKLTDAFAGDAARARAAARLCTQGALARAYAELRAAHPPPRHVLSVPGSCQEHRIDIDTHHGVVRHARVFLLAQLTLDGEIEPMDTLRMICNLGPV